MASLAAEAATIVNDPPPSVPERFSADYLAGMRRIINAMSTPCTIEDEWRTSRWREDALWEDHLDDDIVNAVKDDETREASERERDEAIMTLCRLGYDVKVSKL